MLDLSSGLMVESCFYIVLCSRLNYLVLWICTCSECSDLVTSDRKDIHIQDLNSYDAKKSTPNDDSRTLEE